MCVGDSNAAQITELVGLFHIDPAKAEIVPAIREEDGSPYEVWYVNCGSERYVLKKAKEYERAVYTAFLSDLSEAVPKCCGFVRREGDDYFLMEYARGETLSRCSREKLVKALDALIFLQDRYWNNRDKADVGFTFEKSLPERMGRGDCLKDAAARKAYRLFRERYAVLPRTLCHDDLLPFNVLVSEEKATIIDWEFAGILPYLTSLARLIAHGQEDPDAFFYMRDEDKQFAIRYYYDHLVKGKGIPWADYRRDLQLFLLFEYCEWIQRDSRSELSAYYQNEVKKLLRMEPVC
jgi:hypothetical protein